MAAVLWWYAMFLPTRFLDVSALTDTHMTVYVYLLELLTKDN